MMSSQISGMILMFGMSQVIKRFDLANQQNALIIRIVYAIVQLLNLAVLGYIRHLIVKNKFKGTVTVTIPPKPFSEEEPKTETISIEEYDNRELLKNLQSTIMGMFFLIAIHVWMGALQPLIFQSIFPLKSLFSNNLFQIYILGKKAEGKLQRPFKEPNPFGELMQNFSEKIEDVGRDEEPTGIVELKEEDEIKEDEKKSEEEKEEEEPLLKNRTKKTHRKDE